MPFGARVFSSRRPMMSQPEINLVASRLACGEGRTLMPDRSEDAASRFAPRSEMQRRLAGAESTCTGAFRDCAKPSSCWDPVLSQ